MIINKRIIDDLNAIITVSIEKDDYQSGVDKTLINYRMKSTLSGYRKGQVPIHIIKKQYEKSTTFDEVNKALQIGLSKYIVEEKLAILGNPIPVAQSDLEWNKEIKNFDFEVGLAPSINLDLKSVEVDNLKIIVTEEEINKYVENFSNRFGKLKTIQTVNEEANVSGIFIQLDENGGIKAGGIEEKLTLTKEQISKTNNFEGKKVGDEIVVKAQDLFEKASDIVASMGITNDEASEINSDFKFIITEVSALEPSEVNQELFDKVYGENTVKSEAEFRSKIKEESEKIYIKETDKQLLNEVTLNLIDNTQFDLPKAFLIKWLSLSNKNITTKEQAEAEYANSEKALRYQLIENKLAEQNNINVSEEEIIEETKLAVKAQMAMYGQMNFGEDQLDEIILSVLKNKDEYKRMADEVYATKLTQFFKANVKLNNKDVTVEEFIEIVNKKQEPVLD